jgi:hypothetical protein
MLMKDELDKEELAYAAQESILQSLEDLPLPAKTPEENSFTEWLKRHAAGPFGQVEEVHAGTLKSNELFALVQHLLANLRLNLLKFRNP